MSKFSPLCEHTVRRRVQFRETDAAGIVHFSCFFLYMEEAEHALWREAGLSIARGRAGVGFPRVAASFDFLRPLYFEDEVDVSIRIVTIEEKTIRYVCALTRGGESIATGSMTIICVTRDGSVMKASVLPPDVRERFRTAPDAGG